MDDYLRFISVFVLLKEQLDCKQRVKCVNFSESLLRIENVRKTQIKR